MSEQRLKLAVVNGHAYATSLDLAKHFNKRHDNILRDIVRVIAVCADLDSEQDVRAADRGSAAHRKAADRPAGAH